MVQQSGEMHRAVGALADGYVSNSCCRTPMAARLAGGTQAQSLAEDAPNNAPEPNGDQSQQ